MCRCRKLGSVELCDELFRDLVAIAGGGFEMRPVEDGYVTAAVLDEARFLQGAGDECDGGAPGAEHHAEELLGEVESVGLGAILGHEEPACEALFGFVQPVTTGDLAGADALLLNEFENAISDFVRGTV